MEQTGQSSPKAELCEALNTVDTSIGYLLLIVASIVLSFISITVQRQQLVYSLEERPACISCLPAVFPIKKLSSALVIGALCFYFCLAARINRQAVDCVARRSGAANLWASAFVLIAAIIRYIDLVAVEQSQPTLQEEDILPE